MKQVFFPKGFSKQNLQFSFQFHFQTPLLQLLKKKWQWQKNRSEENCNTSYKYYPSYSFDTHTISMCSSLEKLFFSPNKRKGYLDSSRKHKGNTLRVWFTRTHLLFDIGTAAVVSLKHFPWACSDTEAAQPASGRGNQLHGHLCFRLLCSVHPQNRRCSSIGFTVLCLTEKKGAKPSLSLSSSSLQNEVSTLPFAFNWFGLHRLWLCSKSNIRPAKRLTALLC